MYFIFIRFIFFPNKIIIFHIQWITGILSNILYTLLVTRVLIILWVDECV